MSEWSLIEGGMFILKELQNLNEIWRGDKYSTTSEVIPSVFKTTRKNGGFLTTFLAKSSKNNTFVPSPNGEMQRQ